MLRLLRKKIYVFRTRIYDAKVKRALKLQQEMEPLRVHYYKHRHTPGETEEYEILYGNRWENIMANLDLLNRYIISVRVISSSLNLAVKANDSSMFEIAKEASSHSCTLSQIMLSLRVARFNEKMGGGRKNSFWNAFNYFFRQKK